MTDFYGAMQEEVGKKIPPIIGNFYRYGDTRHIFSDTQKLQSLGWRPVRSVKESIRDYWRYLRESAKKEDILSYAESHMKKLNVIRKVKN